MRGKLGTGEGVWTQIDCPRDTCCSEQLAPFASVEDAGAELALAGKVALSAAVTEELRCVSRAGFMVRNYAEKPDAPVSFTRWDRRRDGEPASERLERAYCCNVDVRGQEVIVEATFEARAEEFAPHRLLDPRLCELPGTG